MLSLDDLKSLANDILAYAKTKGASDAAVDLSVSIGQSASVRCGNVENLEYAQEQSAGVAVFLGKKRAAATCSILTQPALKESVDAALAIAKFGADDDCAGLPDAEFICRDFPDLKQNHPVDLPMDSAIAYAKTAEDAAFSIDSRIINSEGANFSTSQGFFISAHTHNFCAGFPYSRYSISAAVIAEENNAMQRDFWFDSHCNLDKLQQVESIGKTAAARALKRLNPKKIRTNAYPVLFENSAAASLLAHFIGAASGGNLYRGASFLLNKKGERIFSPIVSISEHPFLVERLSSSSFDDEGVATRTQKIVDEGILQSYFLSAYSARKLNEKPTGHAGGVHNLAIDAGNDSFESLIKKMHKGVLITELLGQGVNLITGDYSRGACGFWVENGEIQHPVEEITIAGNLQDMFLNIAAVGNDVLVRGAKSTPSLLIETMTVAN